MYDIHISMEFEWHEKKAKSNFSKHKVLFYDPCQISFEDPDNSEDEFREILIGHSNKGRLLLVAHTLRKNKIRIISTRLTTKREMRAYAKRI